MSPSPAVRSSPMAEAATSAGGNGIISYDIDLSGSLELTAKAGSPNGKALSRVGSELDLNTIKDKLDPGAKVTATDADGKVIQQVSIPRPVEPEEPSSSSDSGSAHPVRTRLFPPRPRLSPTRTASASPTPASGATTSSPSASGGSRPLSTLRCPRCVSCGLRASTPSPSRPSSAPPPSRWTSCWPWAARTPRSVLTHRFIRSSSAHGGRQSRVRLPCPPMPFCAYTMDAEICTDRGKVTYGWRPSYSFHLF